MYVLVIVYRYVFSFYIEYLNQRAWIIESDKNRHINSIESKIIQLI